MNEAPPSVSVILPVYNRLESLALAMRSVLDQSFGDLELIVADDASSEDVGAVVKGFNDPRVRYVRRESNGGAAAARNTGISLARGRYIAFQDSDDLWLPGKLERQVALLESQPPEVGVVVGAKILYGRDNEYNFGVGRVAYAPPAGRWLTLEEDQLQRSLLENRISLQNAVFRRKAMPDEPMFDLVARANVDWIFTVRLTQRTKIFEDPEPVVFSYISADSVSTNRRRALMGRIRVLQVNRAAYERYPAEHAKMLGQIGVLLIREGRARAGRGALRKAIRVYPPIMLGLAGKSIGAGARRFFRILTRCRALMKGRKA
ncbi:glycosyltransferase family 2 protein [Primorskyibacter sp. 2E233]|uniref:glycosyltransferase family 2 protein n=1 Tax=Primorskyibacter sp. 2E233 TaxID=3413431 RepID=UPI003BF2EC21